MQDPQLSLQSQESPRSGKVSGETLHFAVLGLTITIYFRLTAGSWLICWASWAGPGLISLSTKKDLGIIFSSPVTLDTEKIHCCAWLPWRAVSVAAGTPLSSWLQRWWWLYQQWLLEEVCQNSSWSRGPFLVFFPPIELSVRSSCKRHYCCSKKT